MRAAIVPARTEQERPGHRAVIWVRHLGELRRVRPNQGKGQEGRSGVRGGREAPWAEVVGDRRGCGLGAGGRGGRRGEWRPELWGAGDVGAPGGGQLGAGQPRAESTRRSSSKSSSSGSACAHPPLGVPRARMQVLSLAELGSQNLWAWASPGLCVPGSGRPGARQRPAEWTVVSQVPEPGPGRAVLWSHLPGPLPWLPSPCLWAQLAPPPPGRWEGCSPGAGSGQRGRQATEALCLHLQAEAAATGQGRPSRVWAGVLPAAWLPSWSPTRSPRWPSGLSADWAGGPGRPRRQDPEDTLSREAAGPSCRVCLGLPSRGWGSLLRVLPWLLAQFWLLSLCFPTSRTGSASVHSHIPPLTRPTLSSAGEAGVPEQNPQGGLSLRAQARTGTEGRTNGPFAPASLSVPEAGRAEGRATGLGRGWSGRASWRSWH